VTLEEINTHERRLKHKQSRRIKDALLNTAQTVQAFRVLLADMKKAYDELEDISEDNFDAWLFENRKVSDLIIENADLHKQLAAKTADRDNQRELWHASESERWTGELREQLATVTAQRDEALQLAFEAPPASHSAYDMWKFRFNKLQQEIEGK
jgi:hypothetical protein